MSKLDFLKEIGKDSDVKDNRENKENGRKKYKCEKLIKALNPDIEQFFDEKIKGGHYSTYSQFIKAAIYDLANKHGFNK